MAAYRWRVLCVVSGGTVYAHGGRDPGGKGRAQGVVWVRCGVGEVWVRCVWCGWGVGVVWMGCGVGEVWMGCGWGVEEEGNSYVEDEFAANWLRFWLWPACTYVCTYPPVRQGWLEGSLRRLGKALSCPWPVWGRRCLLPAAGGPGNRSWRWVVHRAGSIGHTKRSSKAYYQYDAYVQYRIHSA